MKESKFQHDLIEDIKARFPGAIVMKTDPRYIQGLPDLVIFWNNHWAALECKKTEAASKQPNQEYYVNEMNDMSFARFVYPENKEDVLNEMERSFYAQEHSRPI